MKWGKMGLKLFAAAGLFSLATPVFAETLYGEQLYKNPGRGGCINCHGEGGNVPVIPLYPKIGGQTEMYLFNQMMDYKKGKRKNGLYMTMETAMKPFSEDEVRVLAAYLAAVEWPRSQ
ncbi:c-type cytochrome [Enterovibrio sp. ZSDZ35]|uniref:C-type cytochrome n=1 Tax=Enterovibrio qingdaonensis TaxID=2899818 RepID=A0ABT5QJA7_9GAMM|nr:c-type cytochrome [Enterovibrio sp. ZSDZ35]MDD1781073.1 c-type cytochrome [Enterovibrio sp. ZSDZ35]